MNVIFLFIYLFIYFILGFSSEVSFSFAVIFTFFL